MLRNIKDKFLDNHDQIMLLSVLSSTSFTITCLIFVLHSPPNYLIIAMATGMLVHSILLAGTYHGHNSKQRLFFGMVVAVSSGFAFAFGSFNAHSLLQSTIGLVIVMFFVGLVDNRHSLLSTSMFFFGTTYILGFGMPSAFPVCYEYGVWYAMGAMVLVILGIIRLAVRSYYFNLHETMPILDPEVIVWFDYHKMVYICGLLLSVLLCNFLSFYFHLKHGYWLPLTAYLLIRNNHTVSFNRTIHRLVGTLLGGGMAFLWSLLVTSKLIMALAMFPFLYFTLIAASKHYGSFIFFFTITICNLINIAAKTGVKIVEQRILYTLLGVLIVMIILHAIRPMADKLIKKV